MTGEPTQISGPTIPDLLAVLLRGADLPAADAEAAFSTVMEGRATPVQVAALLTALRAKGECPTEVAGGVRALRAAMVPVAVSDPEGIVDTCGTGGGAVTTFNISTAAALLAAGAGVRIAKHGNRSFTSRCGSADVLAALGVSIELSPEAMADVFDAAGIVFMFAPLLHPAMRHVGQVRREMGVATIMNILGPLTNPAGARRQVIGVSDPSLLPLIAGGLRELGHERALVVHGEPGLDEISPIGPTDIIELKAGELTRYTLDPVDLLGDDTFDPADLAGGDPSYNADIVLRVLRGELKGAARAAVLVNAAAALLVAGAAGSLADGARLAEEALEDGAGIAALERLRTSTRAAAIRN